MLAGSSQPAKWVSRRWWDRQFELMGSDGDKLASMSVRGSQATAAIGDREYRIQRLPRAQSPSITVREAHAENDIAQFDFAGERGLLTAELAGGELFRLRCIRWWRREWDWTDAGGDTVLSARSRWSGLELRPAPEVDPYTWMMLGVLHLALREVSRPWF